jgi:hypothetical protein
MLFNISETEKLLRLLFNGGPSTRPSNMNVIKPFCNGLFCEFLRVIYHQCWKCTTRANPTR